MEFLKEFYNSISILDLIYLIITILSLIKCYRKGFILSILAGLLVNNSIILKSLIELL